jgi:hypothetical protein
MTANTVEKFILKVVGASGKPEFPPPVEKLIK